MGKSINVQNYYLAEITEEDGNIKHGTPEKVFGLMKANRVPQVSSAELYEEGILSEQINELTGHTLAFDFGDLPTKWRAYIQGLTTTNGVISDEGPCPPKPFAVGWEVVKSNGTKQMVWYIYCLAKPIEDTDEQKGKDIKISNDTINVTAFKKEQFNKRGYILIDTSQSDITSEIQENFFKKVQTNYTIAAI